MLLLLQNLTNVLTAVCWSVQQFVVKQWMAMHLINPTGQMVNEKFCILIKISLKSNWQYLSIGLEMAGPWIDDRPLSKPMLTWSAGASLPSATYMWN